MVVDCDALSMIKHFLFTFLMTALISQDIDHVSVVNTSTTLYELCYSFGYCGWKSFSILCNNIIECICSGIHGSIEMLVISLLGVLLFWA